MLALCKLYAYEEYLNKSSEICLSGMQVISECNMNFRMHQKHLFREIQLIVICVKHQS